MSRSKKGLPAVKRRAVRILLFLLTALTATQAAASSYCSDEPRPASRSASFGRASRGWLKGGVPLVDGASARVLPRRHKERCLHYGTERLVRALARAGAEVQARYEDSPPLGVGDLSRAAGGPIPPYSRSHQSGRDADLAFYVLEQGRSVPADDLVRIGPSLKDPDGRLVFDVARNWRLVEALLSDDTIEVRWLFVSEPLKRALLDEAKRRGAAQAMLEKAAQVLHQPSDAPPHDDHFHLRIGCAPGERQSGCEG